VAKYFEGMLSCDFQRFMRTSLLARHFLAFISAFYAIVLTETDKETNPKTLWDYFLITLTIYAIFIISTKAKAQFIFPMFALLLIDQLIKVYLETRENASKKAETQVTAKEKSSFDIPVETLESLRNVLGWGIGAFITAGAVSYYFRQLAEFGDEFSTYKFIVGTFKCNFPNNNMGD
jgi:hypothetical protein